MESWTLQGSCKVCETLGFTLTFKAKRSIHDSMKRPKIEFITYININYIISHLSINIQISYKSDIEEVLKYQKCQIFRLNVMVTRVQRQ